MGFTPQQVDDMSMWQFFAALNGYIDANTPRQANKLTEFEIEDIFDSGWLESGMAAGTLRTQTYWLDGDRLVPWRVVEFSTDT